MRSVSGKRGRTRPARTLWQEHPAEARALRVVAAKRFKALNPRSLVVHWASGKQSNMFKSLIANKLET